MRHKSVSSGNQMISDDQQPFLMLRKFFDDDVTYQMELPYDYMGPKTPGRISWNHHAIRLDLEEKLHNQLWSSFYAIAYA